jgi:hypothetical protein
MEKLKRETGPENAESTGSWEELRDSATADAAEMMSEAGLDDLEGEKLIEGLKELIAVINENGENRDRYAAEAIVQTMLREEAVLTYQKTVENLPLAA